MKRQFYIYIMTNAGNKVLYTGITNDLMRRVYEHKAGIHKGFTQKYKVNKLVYYEATDNIESAISREKQIKGGSRSRKIELINSMNSKWEDLYDKL
jgi:putative endonuclease